MAKIKPYPWTCGECHEKTIRAAVVPEYQCTRRHDGHDYDLAVADLAVHQCLSCRNVVLDDTAEERIEIALRSAVGLHLSPADIRRHREELGLKQKELAAILRLSEATLSRWETGGQIPQRMCDLLMHTFFTNPSARLDLLRIARSQLAPELYDRLVEGTSRLVAGTADKVEREYLLKRVRMFRKMLVVESHKVFAEASEFLTGRDENGHGKNGSHVVDEPSLARRALANRGRSVTV